MKPRVSHRHIVPSHEHRSNSMESHHLLSSSESKHHIFLLIVLSTVCFSTNINGDFVFDDAEAVVNNAVVQGKLGFWDLFTTDFWGKPIRSDLSHKSYRPITTLTFMMNRVAFGLNTWSYHVVNIVLHSIVTVLVYQTTRSVAKRLRHVRPLSVALHTAVLFAVHPVHCEAVSNIVGRAELLMSVFVLLVLELYLRCMDIHFSVRNKGAIVCLSLCALFSKEQGIVALPICAVFDVLTSGCSPSEFLETLRQRHMDQRNNNQPRWKHEVNLRSCWSCLRRALQCTVASMALVILRLVINDFKSPKFSHMDNPIAFLPSCLYRGINYCYLLMLNLWILVNPSHLCFDYSMGCIPLISSMYDYRFFMVLAFIVTTTFVLYKMLMSSKQINQLSIFGISIAMLAFLPASNAIFTVGFVIAERVLYLPSFEFCLVVAVTLDSILAKLNEHSKAEMLRFAAFMLVFLAATKSMKRSSEWRTELDLYTSGLGVCPGNAKIHYNLGKVLADSGDTLTAEISYKNAIRLNPAYDHAINNLANIYLLRERYREAEILLKQCVELRWHFAAAWMNLGLALLGQSKFAESEQSFRTSLSIRPNYADCMYNLGNLYLQQDRKHLAQSIWRNVTRIDPSHERAWVNLLVVLDELGECEEVLIVGEVALDHLENTAPIHFQMGTCYGKMAHFQSAEHHLHKAISIKDNALYWTNLGILYQRWNRDAEAIDAYLTTLKLDPSSQTAKINLEKLNGNVKPLLFH